ncbi:MAG: cell cycle protein [Clostridia bacterium]|jgi:cell division protein FtsW (lipid II flippase)|nr:cell cycle protein [Clostridia bacterium]
MAYFNLMILLSRYIFAGFGILFIIVSFSFMKPFTNYSLGRTSEKNKFLYLCLAFFHLGGISIVGGKQADLVIRTSIIMNGVIVFALITITLWLLRLWRMQNEMILWNLMFFLIDIGYIMLERLDHKLASKQIIAYGIGVLIALVFPSIFAVLIRPANKYLYLCVLAVTMVIPFFFGSKVLGATNWVEIAGMSLQPSEIGKIALVLFLAALFNHFDYKVNKKETIVFSIAVIIIVLGCLVLQRDLGAALLYYLTFLVMLFMATQKPVLPALGLFAGAFGGVIGYFMFGHVRNRVEAWLNPWQDISDTGYQVVQGLFAIGTWGWFGSGLTRGTPNKIPFAETDYIFAALCEEFGTLMGIIVLLCYLGIILHCMNAALKQKNEFYRLILIGIGALFTVQIFIIVGGVLKLVPLTGITSPFLSAGGSSMVVCIGMIGLITYFSHKNNDERVKEETHGG